MSTKEIVTRYNRVRVLLEVALEQLDVLGKLLQEAMESEDEGQ